MSTPRLWLIAREVMAGGERQNDRFHGFFFVAQWVKVSYNQVKDLVN
jgi:hypothetical protein